MRKAFISAALLVSVSSSPASSQDLGKIVIYRPSKVVGAAVACPVRYKGTELVELGRSKFAEWTVPAGRYVLTNKVDSVEVTVAPGETRYVRCTVSVGFLAGKSNLQIVDRESFEEHSSDYERKEISAAIAP